MSANPLLERTRDALVLLRVSLDRAMIYLPAILIAVLALSTYWLVRNAPEFARPPVAAVAPTHEPDAFLRNFTVRNYLPTGVMRSQLWGQTGHHYPDTDTYDVQQLRALNISDAGRVMHSSANRGLSNGDATEIQLFDKAVVVRDSGRDPDGKPVPRLEFRGNFLHVYTDTERVTSNQPVMLMRDADQFSGDTMEYDHLSGTLNMRGRVHGLIKSPSAAAAQPPVRSPVQRAGRAG
ncbi:MAG: LPS export ABC transporter periplasmic protein LptC [Burkholderiaceae bacterium]|jgi:lipopolysaccharide export system protein LptC|nr:LPS export ABC transporter periplasmic protein LptC [Burkholderiaceae bacterium]